MGTQNQNSMNKGTSNASKNSTVNRNESYGNMGYQVSKGGIKRLDKSQLISEWIYEVIVSPKKWTKNCQDFCPHYKGKKSWQFFDRILGETMTSWIHSENNWPLVCTRLLSKNQNTWRIVFCD